MSYILYSDVMYCTGLQYAALWVFGYFYIYVTSIMHNKNYKIFMKLCTVYKPFLTRKLVFRASDSSSTARAKYAQHNYIFCDRMYFSTEFNELFLLVLIASHYNSIYIEKTVFPLPHVLQNSPLPDKQQDYTVVFL